jgi:hypothetical protein
MTAKDTMKKGKHMNEKLKIVVIKWPRPDQLALQNGTLSADNGGYSPS